MAEDSMYITFSSFSSSHGWDQNTPPRSTPNPKSLLNFNPNRIYHPQGLLGCLGLKSHPDVVVRQLGANIEFDRNGSSRLKLSLMNNQEFLVVFRYAFIHLGRLDVSVKVQSHTNPGKSFLMCLLDTRYPKFEQALIAACEAPLDGGQLTFCLSPNYSLSVGNDCHALELYLMVKGVEEDERPVQLSVTCKLCMKFGRDLVPRDGVKDRSSFHGLYVSKGEKKVQRLCPNEVLIPRVWLTDYASLKREQASQAAIFG